MAEPGWHLAPLWVLLCVTSFQGAVQTHNAIHCPVFRHRWINKIYQVVLSLIYGHPVSSYVPGHNLSHHKHTQTRRDVMRTSKARFRWNLLNGLLFVTKVGGSITRADMAYARTMRTRHPRWFRQLVIELGAVFAAHGVLLWLDWQRALLLWFVPHMYAQWAIITMNLLQHDGCDEDSEYNHSRNFVGRIVNWWTFNNGYHTVHHMQPGLHWSRLPEAHAERVAPHIHPNLDQPSLLAYLWRTFFLGRRVRYDGTPLVLPEEGPDEDWIPRPEDTPEDLGGESLRMPT
ncbi:MAG: fatty acid desaturase family protein [Polyangiales bacterium]